MYCKYLNLRNNEELAQITMRKRNSTLNQSTLNCPGLDNVLYRKSNAFCQKSILAIGSCYNMTLATVCTSDSTHFLGTGLWNPATSEQQSA